MKYPENVSVIDSTLRDGLQHEERYIPLQMRSNVLQLLIDAGVREIELGSLSHPLYLPQFKEIDRFLLGMIPNDPNVEYTVLALNKKAVTRAIELVDKGAKIDRVLTGQIATSETYAQKNMNRTREALLAEAKDNVALLHRAGIKKVCANVGTIFGCPIQGDIPLSTAYEYVGRLFDMGFDEIEHSDPSGIAAPNIVFEYFSEIRNRWPDPARHTFHVHDLRGTGLLNYVSAMQAGIIRFECALGGIGGQPANQVDGVPVKGTGDYYIKSGRTGLVSLEDFSALTDRMNIWTGLRTDALIQAGLEMEQILARNLDSAIVASERWRNDRP